MTDLPWKPIADLPESADMRGRKILFVRASIGHFWFAEMPRLEPYLWNGYDNNVFRMANQYDAMLQFTHFCVVTPP